MAVLTDAKPCQGVLKMCLICPSTEFLLNSQNWASGGPNLARSCAYMGGVIQISNRFILPADGVSFGNPSEGMLGVVSDV